MVVVTGGHREQAVDVFFDGERLVELPGERHPDGAAHGSGCTHSSVLAARLAWGDDPLEAARVAKRMASEAVRNGLARPRSGRWTGRCHRIAPMSRAEAETGDPGNLVALT